MSRAAFTTGFLIISATASGAENYCPESSFTEFASGEIDDGDFHVGYTSGYQIDAQGQLMFRRCALTPDNSSI